MKRNFICVLIVTFLFILTTSESCNAPTSDEIQTAQQETILKEGAAQVAMPSIKNFREKKIMKDIYERRDQNGLGTFTYVFSEISGKFTYLGESIGYAIPAATQFTSPQKPDNPGSVDRIAVPQADPNGLYSPASAEGSWIVMWDPVQKEALPQYSESRLSVFSYKLPARLVVGAYKD